MNIRVAPVILLLAAACSAPTGDSSTTSASSVPTPSTTTIAAATTSTPPTTRPVTTTTVWTGPPLYEYVGMTVQAPDADAVLCFGPTDLPIPPACGGFPVLGLDWGEIPWAETLHGTTWATVRLVGTFDGTAFTVVRPPEPGEFEEGEPLVFEIPCPIPPGGWVVTDVSTATGESKWEVKRYAEAQRDFAGTWISYLSPPDESGLQDDDPGGYVLVVGFTGRIAEHREHLKTIYGGPLCVAQRDRTITELETLLDELRALLDSAEARDHGIWVPSHADVSKLIFTTPPLDAFVFAITSPEAYAWVDEHFGKGLVTLRSALTPVGPDA